MSLSPASSGKAGYPLGLTGATAATRYVGATASGAPASGTFLLGDFVIDQTGSLYVCTVAGSPGTWTQVGPTAGSSTLLYDSTLGADTASIDTGAAGISTSYKVLEVFIVARTDEAAVISTVAVTVNNDTSAIYDQILGNSNNGGSGAQTLVAQTAWSMRVHGNNGSASYPGTIALSIPAYAQTTFWKSAQATWNTPDATLANGQAGFYGLGYRATTAVSRMKIAAGGGTVLRAGSRLSIYGRS